MAPSNDQGISNTVIVTSYRVAGEKAQAKGLKLCSESSGYERGFSPPTKEISENPQRNPRPLAYQ
jgi:hypothetical protein